MKNNNVSNQVALSDSTLEGVVLGAILIESFAYEQVAEMLHIDLFYTPLHREVYTCIRELVAEKSPIDIMIVSRKHRELYNANYNVAFAISELTSRVNSSNNIKYHVVLLHQLNIKRQMQNFGVDIMQKAETTDALQLLENAKSKIAEIENTIPSMQTSSFFDIFANTVKEIETAIANKKEGVAGIDTGITYLNEITGGWQSNTLIVIGARPGMGKTSLAIHFLYHAAIKDVPVAFFSLEMQKNELARKIISTDLAHQGIKVTSSFMKKGTLQISDFEKVCNAKIQNNNNIIIYDTAGMHLSFIRSEIHKVVREKNVKLVLIDYLQMIKCLEINSTFRREVIDYICKELKEVAKEHNITIILLSQLTRDADNKRPSLSDLKESSGIEESADVVIFPYRDYYYTENESDKHLIELNIAKNREGATKNLQAYCNMAYSYFSQDTPIEDNHPQTKLPNNNWITDNNNDNDYTL